MIRVALAAKAEGGESNLREDQNGLERQDKKRLASIASISTHSVCHCFYVCSFDVFVIELT